MSSEVPTGPTLRGVRVAGSGPIEHVLMSLEPGLTVLYGTNGAGKSTLLNGIAESIAGGSFAGERELIFDWPVPSHDEWLSGRGYRRELGPWWRPEPPPDSKPGTTSDYRRSLTEAGCDPEGVLGRLAREILLQDWCAWSPVGSPALDRRTAAVAEVVAQGRFSIVRRCDSSSGRGAILADLLVRYSSDATTPNADSLRDENLGLIPRQTSEDENDNDLLFSDICPDDYVEFNKWIVPSAERNDPSWYGQAAALLNGVDWTPADLLNEGTFIDLEREVIGFVDRWIAARPNKYGELDEDELNDDEKDEYNHLFHTADDALLSLLERELSARASTTYSTLLQNAPLIDVRFRRPHRWLERGSVDIAAVDPSGDRVSLASLSDAQARWARFAVRCAARAWATDLVVIVIDEPERALHRQAERHMFRGLSTLAAKEGTHLIVASHSPVFLEATGVRRFHVRRDEQSHRTVVNEWRPELVSQAEHLGLNRSDTLQFCKVFALVEGEHEVWILDEMFRDELAEGRVEVHPLRGAAVLTDPTSAQLIFDYTNADVCILVDNDRHDRVAAIWSEACQTFERGDDHLPKLAKLTKGSLGAESRFLQEFCSRAIAHGFQKRVKISALSLPDIIDYLPVEIIAPAAASIGDWPTLRRRFNSTGNFKEWMKKQHGACYDEVTVRQAVQALDHIPEDFSRFIALVLG
jgi:energy-coupling factor transporter ATP-binding protein EcfA2